MSAKVPAYSQIGANAKEVLIGSRAGIYQYNRKFTFTSRTSDGVEFISTVTHTGSNSPAEASLKAVYQTGDLSLSAAAQQNGKISLNTSRKQITPGLSLTLTGTYPDSDSAKLGIDYNLPHVTLKSTVNLKSNPVIEAAVTTGTPYLWGGAEASYDTSSNDFAKWTFGGGYTHKEYQLGVQLLDRGETVKATYAHVIDRATDTQVAGEINHNIQKGDSTNIIIGAQTKLDNGALVKARLDSDSILSLHWEAQVHAKTIVGISAQVNARNFDAAPKLGFAASAAS